MVNRWQPRALLARGTFTLGALAASGAAWTFLPPEWAGLTFVGSFVAYNRVRAEGSFENDTRRRIFQEVRAHPAQSIAEIASSVGVSHSTASYHLDRLLEFNLLASTPDGNKTRFFVNGGIFTELERRVLTSLSNGETRRVLATIIAHPGSYRAELTNLLGVSSPTVNWHLQRLLQAGLVREEQRGRNRYLFADPPMLRELLKDLADKTAGSEYDNEGIIQLLRMSGG